MSRRLPKPKKSKAIRVDWDDARRDAINMAAAKCDLSHASFARIALELLVAGKAVSLSMVKTEADRLLADDSRPK